MLANVEALAQDEGGDGGVPGSACYFNGGPENPYVDLIPCEGSVGTIYKCKERVYDYYTSSYWACSN